MKDLLIDRERHKVAVQKLNPPVFEVDRIEPVKQPFWMHTIDRPVTNNNEGTWLTITLLVCAILFAIILFYLPLHY